MDSIMQTLEEDCPACYQCERNGSADPLDEHHVFEGTGLRPLSEKYGLKVYICRNRCHLYGKNAVHQNIEVRRELQAKAQLAFQKRFPELDFVEIFGRNYL